jgi:hypothetical protein
VAQYLEEIPADRNYLLDTVFTQFFQNLHSEYRSALTEFLSAIPLEVIPEFIVTTNYDTLVERVLEKRGVPYLAISHIIKGPKVGRFLCYQSVQAPLSTSDIQTRRQLEEQLGTLENQGALSVLIYKMHGTACMRGGGETIDSFVLTENDYVDFFAQNMLNLIPAKILEFLRTKRLLFLGYALEDWNFRVLLRKLQLIQRKETDNIHRHWAFLLGADEVEVKFWERRGVNLYQMSLDVFLSNLLQNLAKMPT